MGRRKIIIRIVAGVIFQFETAQNEIGYMVTKPNHAVIATLPPAVVPSIITPVVAWFIAARFRPIIAAVIAAWFPATFPTIAVLTRGRDSPWHNVCNRFGNCNNSFQHWICFNLVGPWRAAAATTRPCRLFGFFLNCFCGAFGLYSFNALRQFAAWYGFPYQSFNR
jgi:hypothetical protein